MTAADFTAWMQRRGLNDARAAPLLAADPSEVTRWRTGKRAVSRRVARIIELLDQVDSALARISSMLQEMERYG